MHASKWKNGGMLHRSAAKDHQTRYLGPHIPDRAAVFLIIVSQHALGCRQRFECKPFDIEPSPFNGLYKVLAGGARARNNMNQGFEPGAIHSDRLRDAVLPVNYKLLRQAADNLPTRRE